MPSCLCSWPCLLSAEVRKVGSASLVYKDLVVAVLSACAKELLSLSACAKELLSLSACAKEGGLALKRVDLWNGREQLCSSIFGISAWTRTIRYGLIGLGSTLSKVGTSGR